MEEKYEIIFCAFPDSEDSDDDTSSHEEYIPPSLSKKKLVQTGVCQKLPAAATSTFKRRVAQNVTERSDDELSPVKCFYNFKDPIFIIFI